MTTIKWRICCSFSIVFKNTLNDVFKSNIHVYLWKLLKIYNACTVQYILYKNVFLSGIKGKTRSVMSPPPSSISEFVSIKEEEDLEEDKGASSNQSYLALTGLGMGKGEENGNGNGNGKGGKKSKGKGPKRNASANRPAAEKAA